MFLLYNILNEIISHFKDDKHNFKTEAIEIYINELYISVIKSHAKSSVIQIKVIFSMLPQLNNLHTIFLKLAKFLNNLN